MREDVMGRRLTAFAAAGLLALSLAACETAEGFGRDMQKAGDAIEKEAED